MNSTNDTDAMLGALFDEVLMPMAERMKAAGAEAFPLAPDVSWLSYYVRRRRSAMTPADFTSASCADSVEFATRLGAHWQALGRDELAAQAPLFASAAHAARAVAPASQGPELSPYVYAMF